MQWLVIVSAGLILGLALGHRHANGLYQLPIAGDLGVSRETFSFAIALQNLVWGLAMPFAGYFADRHNIAWVLAGGVLLYIAGLVASGFATTGAGLTLTMGVTIGVALAATTWIVNGAVSRAIPAARRSEALGITGSLGAAMQFLLLPLVAWGIAHLGWRGMLYTTAALFVLTAPLVWMLRRRETPASRPRGPDATDAAARADGAGPEAARAPDPAPEPISAPVTLATMFAARPLWLIWLGFASCGFHLTFIAVHLPAFLADKQLPGHVAPMALALIGLFNIAGTYVFGLAGERFPKRKVLAGIYLVRTIAIAVYVSAPITAFSTLVFAALMGFLWLATAPLTTGLVAGIFGLRSLSMLFGWVFLGHQIGGFLGAWLGGLVFDATGSYMLVWLIAIAIGIVSVVTNWLVDEPRVQRRPVPA